MSTVITFLIGYIVGGSTATFVLIGAFIDREEKKKEVTE